ncbi:PRC-barrel domain-containing protein [Legionella sp. D16C41]|uniref:PRC-barrel domain-containing protein n=1 Tax=Legionella sp. D16C41 TaxID=3402688 RepID=UPI003AF4BA10
MDTNHVVNANDVIGVKVENMQGDNLGKIEALMLDKLSGKVNYVVLSYGGFLGMGNKLFAMPWSIFSYNKDHDCFQIPLNEEQLKNSPGFDKDNWPNMSDKMWSDSITRYYDTAMASRSGDRTGQF